MCQINQYTDEVIEKIEYIKNHPEESMNFNDSEEMFFYLDSLVEKELTSKK